MDKDEFAQRTEALRPRLYKTALMYLGNSSEALDALDEAIYRGLRGFKKLRQAEYFDTWITRILINECLKELKRRRREQHAEALDEYIAEQFDALPLREAVSRLPEELKAVVILKYFSGYTLQECARILGIPAGTAATRQRRALTLLRLELKEEDRNEQDR